MERTFQCLWYHRKWRFLGYLFLPFALLYQFLSLAAKWLGKKQRAYFTIPVIVVGNLTTGGTGKTPTIIALYTLLKNEGFKTGIVSRGYKSLAEYGQTPTLANPTHTAHDIGDEPLLIFQKTQAPMAIHSNRVAAIDALLKAHPKLDLILSDDGLQNPKLSRDIEVVVVDGTRGFGNGLILPAGPLREPKRCLRKSDFCVINGHDPALLPKIEKYCPTDFAEFQYIAKRLIPLQKGQSALHLHENTTIHAVAGIGNPSRFFNTLKKLGFNVIPHIFPDHYAFKAEDFAELIDHPIIMTEKDAVKCHSFSLNNAYALEMEGSFPESFTHAFLSKVRYNIDKKKSELIKLTKLRRTHEQKSA